MIFDDYGWGGPDLTQKGIDGFLSGYHKRINYLGEKDSQVFITPFNISNADFESIIIFTK